MLKKRTVSENNFLLNGFPPFISFRSSYYKRKKMGETISIFLYISPSEKNKCRELGTLSIKNFLFTAPNFKLPALGLQD